MFPCCMKRYNSYPSVLAKEACDGDEDLEDGDRDANARRRQRLSVDKIGKMKEAAKNSNDEFVRKTNSGIVHIGAGNFHRSHQESYLNDLLTSDFEQNKNWLYSGISVLDSDAELHRKLKKNMYKYHIISFDRNGTTKVEEIRTLKDLVLTNDNLLSALSLVCDENIKIVSLTITEPGYATELNDYDRRLIRSCLTNRPLSHQGQVTAFGIIIAGLARRYCLGLRPFTVMSCDNLIQNGEVCKKKCVDATRMLGLDEPFTRWITDEVKYPNTMVDRITPYLDRDEIVALEKKYYLIDQSPVVCESYKSWVVEDNFVDNQRPSWEKVGTIMTNDVEPYEFVKIFLLNIPHSCIAYFGLRKGHVYVHEAIEDPDIHELLTRMITDEIFPILEKIIGDALDWKSYSEQTIDRFKNSYMKDRLDRIARDGLEKLKKQGIRLLREATRHGVKMKHFDTFLRMWLDAVYMSESEFRSTFDNELNP